MMQSVSSSPHFHLVLLGQVGAGKSATGNTILGKNSFKSRKSLKAVTQELQKERVTIDGLCFDIYDTPGFFSPGVQKKDIKGKCQEVLHLNASVPTVFLFVVSTDRFTEQEKKTADIVVKFLGGKHLQNTWILFTKGDELQSNEVTIEEYMEDSEDLKDLVKKLHNRYHVFTNKMSEHDPNNKKQVDDLIVKIRSTNSSISANYLNQHQGAEDLPNSDQILPLISAAARVTSTDENNNPHSRKILLLGKTGVGKSATGNTILGHSVFKSEKDVNAVTTESKVEWAKVNGRDVSVIDTPGFFDTKMKAEKLADEFGRSLNQSKGGLHALLLVFEYGRFTEQEAEMLSRVEKVFGKDVTKHIIIVFTHGDECDHEKLKSGIQKNELLSGVIKKCGGRYLIFNNIDQNNRKDVTTILQMIDTMVERNGGKCYTNEMFKIANMGTFEYVIHLIKEFCLSAIGIFRGGSTDPRTNT
ncbi:GTPase IMAP family member 8 [Triplophysa rosa]|uniref:GTPase IMAP family member 8 n=1 Tax=Triplophysa rosa TaxID=992332 RepID=UPI002545E165|nr:GTPase IMAP family member 8 [Triplophysa rosa]XP_057201980.1 GTPase IMAP family member 8 [Triplophysa rosa]